MEVDECCTANEERKESKPSGSALSFKSGAPSQKVIEGLFRYIIIIMR